MTNLIEKIRQWRQPPVLERCTECKRPAVLCAHSGVPCCDTCYHGIPDTWRCYRTVKGTWGLGFGRQRTRAWFVQIGPLVFTTEP